MAYLVDRRQNLCAIKDLAQLCGAKIGDTDAASQTLLLDRLHFLPYLLQAFGKLHGGVDEKKVDVVEPQLFERLDERVSHGGAFGRLAQLCRDEQLLARFPCGGDARTDGFLVFVQLRAVEVRETRVDRFGHRVLHLLTKMGGSGAKCQQGYGRATVQFDWGVRHFELERSVVSSCHCGHSTEELCGAISGVQGGVTFENRCYSGLQHLKGSRIV